MAETTLQSALAVKEPKHPLINGPWKFDFNIIVLKDHEDNTRPSEMVFDTVEVWVRVTDLQLDKHLETFGKALGNFLGEVIKVDVDKHDLARGKHLRVHAGYV